MLRCRYPRNSIVLTTHVNSTLSPKIHSHQSCPPLFLFFFLVFLYSLRLAYRCPLYVACVPVHFIPAIFPAMSFFPLCNFLKMQFSPTYICPTSIWSSPLCGDCVFAHLLFHQRMGCFNVVWLIQWYKVNHAWPLNGAWLALTKWLHTRNRHRNRVRWAARVEGAPERSNKCGYTRRYKSIYESIQPHICATLVK